MDMNLIKQVAAKRQAAVDINNQDLVAKIDTHFFSAYDYAKKTDFTGATLQLQEALLE
jgi:hypothetical protein